MNSKKYTMFSILFLFFLAALIMSKQLVSPGLFSYFISDAYTYTGWTLQFIEALKEGIIYPRWAPLNFWGYGSPTFILYPPLAFYLVAFFKIFTDSVVVAMNITKFTALFLSATGMFFLVKEFYSDRISLLTASLYVLLPYNIFWIYLGASFATPISLIWFSPILLFVHKYFRYGKFKYLLYAGSSYGGLILTHLIIAYMFTFVIVAFIFYLSIIRKNMRGAIYAFTVILVGILISSAYSLPLFYEKRFLNLKDFGIQFSDFFVLPKLTHNIPASHFWPALYEYYVSFIIFFCIFILLLFFQESKIRRLENLQATKTINRFFFGVSVVSIFLLFGVSTFIWETVPFFKNIQYPARWLTITYFCVIFLSAINFQTLYARCSKGYRYLYLIAFLFSICLMLDYKYINSAHVFTEKELLPIKSDISWAPEHLPAWVDVNKICKDKNFEDRITIIAGKGKVTGRSWKSAERVIDVTAQKPLTLKIRTFNFPGWEANIDGLLTDIKTVKGEGAMVVDIPEGKHTLTLKFQDTPIRYYSKLVSLFSFIVLTFFLVLRRRKLHN
jgi:uncharacterized membrane protein